MYLRLTPPKIPNCLQSPLMHGGISGCGSPHLPADGGR